LAGQAARMSDEEREQIKVAVTGKLREQALGDQKALAQKIQAASQQFLAENAKRPTVKTTASGLQYEVLAAGSGARPGPDDQVTVNYKGALVDGTVFDSSYDRGQPAVLPLSSVIAGWREGLMLMSPGAKFKLYLPAALAYGENYTSPEIPPNSALVFDVELISIAGAHAGGSPSGVK
jgi:FKBP-type peptidyl-prolyl cis-trans isomerase